MKSINSLARTREILSLPPSRKHWILLLQILLQLEGKEADFMVDYVEQHIQHWEPLLRQGCFILQPTGIFSLSQFVQEHTIENKDHSKLPAGLWLQIGKESCFQGKMLHPCWRLVRSLKISWVHFRMPYVNWSGIEKMQENSLLLQKKAIGLLLSEPFSRHLYHMDVSRLGLQKEEVLAFLSHSFESLEIFNLAWNSLDKTALQILLQQATFSNLRFLSIAGAQIGDDALFQIRRAPALKKLCYLDCNCNEISRDVAWSLVHTPQTIPFLKMALLDYLSFRDLLECAQIWNQIFHPAMKRKELLLQLREFLFSLQRKAIVAS